MKKKTLKIVVYDKRISDTMWYVVDAVCTDTFALFDKEGFVYLATHPNGYWEIIATYNPKQHSQIVDMFKAYTNTANILIEKAQDLGWL